MDQIVNKNAGPLQQARDARDQAEVFPGSPALPLVESTLWPEPVDGAALLQEMTVANRGSERRPE